MSTPMTERDETANAKNTPVSRFSTTRSGPAGMTTKSRNVEMSTTVGAMAKMARSAWSGMMSSFWMNFTPSPISWYQPWKPPGSMGPSRLCMWAMVFIRKTYPRVRAAAGMMARMIPVLISVSAQ